MEERRHTRILSPWQRLFGEEFNLPVFLSIVRKSLLWVILFVIASLTAVFLYLRYTPPTYLSSTRLIYKQSEATKVLNFGGAGEKTVFNDLEIIRSPIILSAVYDSLPLGVAYFQRGDVLDDEFYRNAPFRVEVRVKNPSIYGVPVDIHFRDLHHFDLSYQLGGELKMENLSFGERLKTKDFDFVVTLNEGELKRFEGKPEEFSFYFIIRNKSSVLSWIAHNLSFDRIKTGGQILEISMTDRLPARAADILNAIDREYIRNDLERQRQSSKNILAFIGIQLDTITRALRLYENKLKNYKLDHRIIDPGNMSEEALRKLNELEDKITAIGKQQDALDWLEAYVRSGQPIASIATNLIDLNFEDIMPYLKTIQGLQEDIQYRQMSLKDTHLEMQYLHRQLAEAEDYFFAYLDNVRKRLNEEKARVEGTLEDYNARFFGLSEVESKYTEMSRVKKRKEEYYLMLLDKQSQYEIAKAGIVEKYAVLREARGGSKIAPQETTLKLAGLLAGLFLGILLIAVRYLLHNKIQNAQELEALTSIPVMASIPRMPGLDEVPELVVYDNPKSLVSEAFRALRTNLEYVEKMDAPRVIAVTSTVSGEGKTFIAVNLAGILHMTRRKVIILDFDLRKPKIHKVFGATSELGMSTLLIGKHDLAEVIRHTEHEGLDYIPCGPIPPNPSELIVSPRAVEIVEALKEKYDIVICDTPPVGLVSDAMELLDRSNYPLYAVRADFSRKEFLNIPNKLYEENGIRKLSLILNDIRLQRGGYGRYNYGYGYGYGYGYYEGQGKRSIWARLMRR